MNPIMDAATKALGSGRGKKALHMRIEPTENKGFIAHHDMHEDGMPMSGAIPKHALSSLKELIKHVQTHYGSDPNIEHIKAEGAESEAGETKEPEAVRKAEEE